MPFASVDCFDMLLRAGRRAVKVNLLAGSCAEQGPVQDCMRASNGTFIGIYLMGTQNASTRAALQEQLSFFYAVTAAGSPAPGSAPARRGRRG